MIRVGVCGATVDTIVARNFGRMVAAGTAAHTDHGMAMLELFRDVINGKTKDYSIKDPIKLLEIAGSLDIVTEGRELKDVAMDLYHELEKTYTQVDGEIPMVKRVPPKTLELWREAGIVPRGAMREIMEMMHRTAMGVDQDYENITKQIIRTALADGWGGSMVSTDISDILFGTPSPVEVEVDMGVLKEDQVNIIVHGHEPNLLESMVVSVADPTLIEAAKQGWCERHKSGRNVLLRSRGVCLDDGLPHAGNFSSTEAVLVTGAVDAMTVDIQCIKQGLQKSRGYSMIRLLSPPTIGPKLKVHCIFIWMNMILASVPMRLSLRQLPDSKPVKGQSRFLGIKLLVFMVFPTNISIICWEDPSGEAIRHLMRI